MSVICSTILAILNFQLFSHIMLVMVSGEQSIDCVWIGNYYETLTTEAGHSDSSHLIHSICKSSSIAFSSYSEKKHDNIFQGSSMGQQKVLCVAPVTTESIGSTNPSIPIVSCVAHVCLAEHCTEIRSLKAAPWDWLPKRVEDWFSQSVICAFDLRFCCTLERQVTYLVGLEGYHSLFNSL